MKNSRAIIAGAAILILLSASSAFAQGGPPGGGQGGGGKGRGGPPPLPDAEQIEVMVDELDEALDLTDEQEVQVSDLYFAHFEEIEELMSDRPERSRMESLRSDFEDDVKAVLDDDQKAAYEEYLKSQKKNRSGQPPK